jgi:hypothetical protein
MADDVRVRVRVDDDTRRGMEQSTGGIKGAMEKLGPIAKAAGGAMASGLAVATAAAAVLKQALDASIERAAVGAKIAAQTGDTKHAAELGKMAGKVYADNFGESLQDAGNAVRDTLRHHLVPEDAGDDAVKAISEKLLTLGQLAEADSSEVARAVHKMLVTGMAGSADEAFDIITRGIQQGADEAGDLLDTFDEYSIQFKQLGINGKEALGLISQGLRSGARDADTVADTLKEIAIVAQSGSKASVAAFKALGLNGDQLGKMFAQGGEQAHKAFDMVLDKTKAIKDPMQQNAIATGLFGTKAEDLQDALFGLDLDTAVLGLGDIAGAADKASEALGSGLGPMIETFKRKFQQAFADVGDAIAPYVMEAVGVYQEAAGKLAHVFDGSEVPDEVVDALKKVAHDYLPALREGFDAVVGKVEENRETFEKLGHVLAEYIIPAIGFLLVEGVHTASIAIGGMIDGLTFLVDTGTAVRDFAINLALIFVNTFDTIVTGAAKAFGWIPEIGPKLERAAAEVHDFVNRVNNELKNIRDEDVYVRTHFVGGQGQARGGEFRTGGIKGAATGGVREGLTMVGEEGRELVRLPQGAMVYPTANTNQLMAQGGGGGGQVVITFTSDGSPNGDYVLGLVRGSVVAQGGRLELLGLKSGR